MHGRPSRLVDGDDEGVRDRVLPHGVEDGGQVIAQLRKIEMAVGIDEQGMKTGERVCQAQECASCAG
jgi:hypothetical protein